MEGQIPTQPSTQPVLDPRRLGHQNTGFSDEDISDIICILYPHSDSARREVHRLGQENSPFVIGKDDANTLEPNYHVEDRPSQFNSDPYNHGSHAIMLKLSLPPKNPKAGFVFGRNTGHCDIVFTHDPRNRVSNIHFRIYVNEFGNVMVEDQSTNGTYVDKKMLSARPRPRAPPYPSRWVLTSGSLIDIYLHDQAFDLSFRVRIPRRDGRFDHFYHQKVLAYFVRNRLPREGGLPPVNPPPAATDHVDLFRLAGQPLATRQQQQQQLQGQEPPNLPHDNTSSTEWTGSGKYNKVRSIGKGAFAVVYQVTAKYDGRPYAAKELEKRHFVKNGVLDQKVENEMRIMRRLNHPNIVRYIENFDCNDRLFIIIMEFVAQGDLGKLISDKGPFSDPVAQDMAVQLLSALRYLHNFNITHRDVKPDNILISSLDPLQVKLTDFGLSKMIDSDQTFLRTFCGTLLYCAPEVYTEYLEYDEDGFRVRAKPSRQPPGQRYSHAVDVWSLGGVLFYCLTGAPPYPARTLNSPTELLHRVMTTPLNTAPLLRNIVSVAGIDFIRRMLQRRPQHRATVEELESHHWLTDHAETIHASQSFDDVTDDEELPAHTAQLSESLYEYDRVSDSMDEDSDQKTKTLMPAEQWPRLFGEIAPSAIGSSGVFPEEEYPDTLGANHDNAIMASTPDGMADEAYKSSRSLGDCSSNQDHARAVSLLPNQSMDQLQSLVEIVASQSLGSDDKQSENGSPLMRPSITSSVDPNTSKRKPPSAETSDEFGGENTPPSKPTIKRLRSDGNDDALVTNDMIDEYKLLARIPPINQFGGNGRSRDRPVMKAQFWTDDVSTWHLDYPEMTELQLAKFNDAAAQRNEAFLPNRTPLWELAMKYFPPNQRPDSQLSEGVTTMPAATEIMNSGVHLSVPGAMVTPESSQVMTCVSYPRIVPMQTKDQMVAMIESDASSCLKDISLPVTEPMISFGRGPENTKVYKDKMMIKIPKYAFRILLWKHGFDPGQYDPPWRCENLTQDEQDAFFFWISTKATNGILINGKRLRSSTFSSPHDPSENWTRLYDGDTIAIWHDPSNTDHDEIKLRFRCKWGGSCGTRGSVSGSGSGSGSGSRGGSRGGSVKSPELTSSELASSSTVVRLNAGCQRFEARRSKNRMRRKDDAEILERLQNIESERHRNVVFEEKRQEALAYLERDTRRLQSQSTRRYSLATMARNFF